MSTAAEVVGPADTHCTMNGVEIKQEIGMCVADTGGTDDAGATSQDDAAAGDDGGGDNGGASDFGATLYNHEGDDDDCKYHVTWTSTAVKENEGVTFDVTAIRRADGKPALGANTQLEVFIGNHPTPTVDIPTKELGGGKYQVGPVVFDEPGQWTVRFHFYETCSDAPEDSPHGHAAFFIQVP
ncbi:MAG TPA: FixH family protein [Polyangia bacterium]|nr:FixH family protein [Polyangia bacterium]